MARFPPSTLEQLWQRQIPERAPVSQRVKVGQLVNY